MGTSCAGCLETQCTNYLGADLYGPCIDGTPSVVTTMDTDFSTVCTAAFACSASSSDGCGHDPNGPFQCYCGAGVTVDQCGASIAAVRGPCVSEWTAAARCPPDNTDPYCVLDFFVDLTKPSGFANFMSQCMLESCVLECAR